MAKGAKRVSDDARSSEVAPNAGVLGEGVAAVYLPVDAPRPHPKNTRLHGQEVLRLARTIVRTTWGAPLIVQRSTLRIIGGHGRQLAAQEILAGIEVDGVLRGGHEHYFDRDAPGPGLIPVRLLDVSDAEADAMALADNADALQGRDDAALIVEMAAGFGRESALMADMGFDGAALDRLVQSAGDAVLAAGGGSDGNEERHEIIGDAPQGEDPGADELPPDAPVISRAGEVYELGPHRLVCGDGSLVDAVGAVLVLDPPFDSPRFYDAANSGATAVLALHGYALPDQLVRAFAAWPVRFQFVWDGVSSWWTPNRPLARHKACTVLMRDPAWRVDSALIPGDPGPARTVTNSRGSYTYEPIAPDRVRLSTVFAAPTSREDGGHAHSKPERWVAALFSGVGASRVVDPFAGSGTSIVAASRIGAVVEAHEIDPRACDVIRRRWTKYARSAGIDPGPGALD